MNKSPLIKLTQPPILAPIPQLSKAEQFNKELKKEYKRCKNNDIEIINILNLSDKYETKDEIRKIKNQLEKNIKCLIAIRYHKKYNDLVDDIVSNLN